MKEVATLKMEATFSAKRQLTQRINGVKSQKVEFYVSYYYLVRQGER
jgi:hypothetical protein